MITERNNLDAKRLAVINKQASKAGLRGKINAKCCECIYDPHQQGTWLKQVENCTSRACPLYDIRPMPRNGDES